MADHVAVGEVHHDEGVWVVLKALQQLRRDIVGIHLRVRGEGGGVEAAGDVHLVLALVGNGRFAVEEARDMAELLGFGDAELAKAGVGHDLAEEVVHAASRAHRSE